MTIEYTDRTNPTLTAMESALAAIDGVFVDDPKGLRDSTDADLREAYDRLQAEIARIKEAAA